ncbi:hypothetical protein C7S20_09805 [Christiangramia fulva]|uniref:HYR domain-containing protein n=1 Tax=Christiangramia fulva TaxID=2126553 RepID=A0A2R3Z5H8_9FLAO|nr:HYR domain-containing protein [Christiangramia fulva]AVR45536.1 hypothetical protein C7S20_09805 [Christiangramia fulva]
MRKITSSVKTGGFLILFLVFVFGFSIASTGLATGLTVNSTVTNATCDNSNDGSIAISVSGGDGSYTYSWSGPNAYTSTSQNISNLYPGDYTLSVTDNSGNSYGPSTIPVTAVDNVAPTITCVADQNKNTDAGSCDYTVQGNEFDPTSFNDNCSGATITNNFNNTSSLAGAVFPKGTTTVIWTVTDASNNTQTCSFDVTVSDNEKPTITCVADQNKNTDAGSCDYTVQGNEFDPTSFNDNCSGATITNNFNNTSSLAGAVFPKGTTTVIWTVTDASNNTQTCSFDVTVSDNEKPTITCVADQNKNTDAGSCDYTVQGNEFDPTSFADNCTGATITNDFNNTSSLAGAVFPKGTTTVIWTVTDASNNTQTCSFDVTVSDNEKPTITCVADQNKNTDAGSCDYTVQGNEFDPTSFNDNCSGATITNNFNNTSSLAGAVFPKGTTTVIWTVTDASNNTQTCSFDVTITDNEKPTISCVANQNKNTDAGSCDYTVQGNEFDPSSFADNCTGATITNDFNNTSSLAGAVFPKGTTTVIWTVTDASNNTQTCSFDVTVSDNEKPTISCVTDQNKNTDAGSCDYTVQGNEFDPSSFADNCSGATITNNFNNTSSLAGAVFPKGTTTVIWTVTDASNNTQTCSFDVTVSDNEKPTITCVADQNKNTDAGSCDYTVQGNEFDPTSFADNCTGATITNDFNNTSSLAGAVFPKGTTTVIWTVTDASNNTQTCSFDVTVSDIEKPTITCVADQNKNTDAGSCDYTVQGNEFDPTSFADNCTGATITNDFNNTSSLAGAVFPKGTTTVIWTVTDASNNTQTCSFDVTVSDNEKPTITCVADQNKNTDAGSCDYTVQGNEFDPTSFNDNCSGATITNNFNNTSSLAGAVFPKGTTTVIWTVTDASNNTQTCSFDVTVSDNEKPTITCVADQNKNTDAGSCDYTVQGNEFDPTSFADNCTGATITNDFNNTSSLAGAVFPKETTTVIWTVTDASNNTQTCSFDVTVSDNEKPTASNPAAVNVQCEVPEADPSVVIDAADNCTTSPMVEWVSDVSDNNFNPEVVTRTYKVTDEAGNFIEVTQQIAIQDTEIPEIPTLPDIESECPLTIVAPTTTDNCDGVITGTTGLTDLSFDESETVYWIFTDASGNTTGTVAQNVIINNTVPPVPDVETLPIKEIRGCQISSISDLDIPTATDACEGTIEGKLSDDFVFPFSFSGTQTIVWEYIDSQGNTSTQEQNVKLIPEDINGGTIKGTFGSTEFEHQIDISSCGDQISVYLNLTGQIGNIVRWDKYAVNKGIWEEISNNSSSYTATFAAGAFESTYYRVLIQVGTCIEYSDTFYIRALPPGAPPTVTNQDEDNLYCLGEDVNLIAETNYKATQDAIPDSSGDFNVGQLNTQDPNGWLVDGQTGGFTAGGDAKKPRNWSGTNNHPFGGIEFDSEEGKFAIAQGNIGYTTTFESPIMDLSNAESASLDFDQAYFFANNDVASIEISLDGGSTYSTLEVIHPAGSGEKKWLTAGTAESTGVSDSTHYYFKDDNTSIPLDAYLGESNVRIRWSFTGTSDNSVWAMDNILVNKQVYVDTELEWTEGIGDPNENPLETGQTQVPINFIPDTPGIQQYGATALINGCRTYSEEGTDLIDLYISYSYAGEDIVYTSEECGHNQVQLNAYDNTITARENIAKGSFETPASGCRECDAPGTGDIGEWSWNGNSSSCGDVSFSDIHDPDAIFSAPAGTYTLTWTVAGCSNDVVVTITECDKIDFDGTDDHIDFSDNYDLNGNFSLEFWVKPNAINGTRTIFSKRDGNYSGTAKGYDLSIKDGTVFFNWNSAGTINSSPYKVDTSRWYHIAVVHTSSGEYKLYIDGIKLKTTGGAAPGENAYHAILGAMDVSGSEQAVNYFNGWIDEIRIWDVALTPEQMHIMMNQRLQASGTKVTGEVIPIQIPNLNWSDLRAYYRMDKIGIGCGNIIPAIGVEGKIINITTPQENTAPLPYISSQNGSWRDKNTWLRPTVWDVPNAKGINGDEIKWNIAETYHDIYSTAQNIYMLGLVSHSGELKMDGNVPSQTGQALTITHYLKLDGTINLEGESQLIQTEGSILDEASSGYLDRDQQGTENSFNYNYWSSPVSLQGQPNNYGFDIADVLMDGTNPASPAGISFNYQYHYADNAYSGPKRISTFWFYEFQGTADTYGEWSWFSETDLLEPGVGWSMKGTSGSAPVSSQQNYVFRGKPNNGNITLDISNGENRLVGNPYPSAIDGDQFIRDNLRDVEGGTASANIFNGSLYFWDHFGSRYSHYLVEYVGGYGVYNLSGGIPAIATDERIDATGQTSTKAPARYIPVAQGFFVNTVIDDAAAGNYSIAGGNITFRNAQRVFVKESSGDSYFLAPEKAKAKSVKQAEYTKDTRYKIRLSFSSPKGYHRQILVTADSNTKNGFDLGYDAPLIEDNAEDMYWLINESEYVIQAVPNFNRDQVLPLGIKIGEQGEFSIQIDKTENFEKGIDIYLHDKKDSIYFNLQKTAFKATAEPGYINDRYEIVFQKPSENNDATDPDMIATDLKVDYLRNSQEIVLSNPDLLDVRHVELYTLNGQLIKNFDNLNISKAIYLPVERPLSAAVYVVRVFTSEKEYSKKVIISE